MNVATIPGYPVEKIVWERMTALVEAALDEQTRSIHPDGHGAGAAFLFIDAGGDEHVYRGSSYRDREQEIRDCAEKLALKKIEEQHANDNGGHVAAIAIVAAVDSTKDMMCQFLRVRPPCHHCRSMLGESRFVQPTTAIIMVNPGKNLVIHQAEEIFSAYGYHPW